MRREDGVEKRRLHIFHRLHEYYNDKEKEKYPDNLAKVIPSACLLPQLRGEGWVGTAFVDGPTLIRPLCLVPFGDIKRGGGTNRRAPSRSIRLASAIKGSKNREREREAGTGKRDFSAWRGYAGITGSEGLHIRLPLDFGLIDPLPLVSSSHAQLYM